MNQIFNKKKVIYGLTLTALVIGIIILPANLPALDTYQTSQQHILKSASELNYPPFAIVSDDGQADGFSVDLLKEVTKVMGLKISFKVAARNDIKQELADGKLDILPLVANCKDHHAMYDFSIPYILMHGTVFVRRNEKSIKTLADLHDKEVLVIRGDKSHEYAVRNNISTKLILKDNFEDAMKLLSTGKHDAVIIQYLVGLQIIKKLGITNLIALPENSAYKKDDLTTGSDEHSLLLPGFKQKFCFAVHKGNKELIDLIDEGLAITIANGSYTKLYTKWFSPILPPHSITQKQLLKYIFYIGGAISLILGFGSIVYLHMKVRQKTTSLQQELQKKEDAMEALKNSAQEWSAAMDASEDAVYLLDINRHILRANKVFYQMTRSAPQNTIGCHIEKIIHPQGEKKPCPVCRAQEEMRDEIIIMEAEHSDNPTPMPIEVTIKIVKDKTGQPISIFMKLHDLTEQRKVENALRKGKEEWEKTFDAIADIITIQDKDMRIIRANKAAHDMFQVESGGLNDKYCYEVFRSANEPCKNCPQLLTIADSTNHSANIPHDNLGKIFQVTSSPIIDKDGGFTHFVHIAKDITQSKKLEENLFQAHKMEAMGNLAGGIAHDFNNILTAILGYADLTKLEIPTLNHAHNYIDEVLKAGGRAKELVQQILTFSRKNQKTQQPLRPSSIIKEALKLMRASLPATIEIHEEIVNDCGLILANPTNIHQILVNLCTNAFHAMTDEKGTITVKLLPTELNKTDLLNYTDITAGPFIELMVSDTGCGIDKETMKRIFEPYFTTKEVGKGTGMGLALIHGMVKSCGGFTKVTSKPDVGTTFHVYFPAIEGKPIEIEKKEQEVLPEGNERILAVDDEEAIVGIYKATLEQLGYQITTFCSSKKALAEFKASPDSFDLIITDQTMPRLTGIELTQEILKIRPDIPAILSTGFSSMASAEKAKEIGITQFAMKPVSRRDLAFMVRDVLDKAKSQIV